MRFYFKLETHGFRKGQGTKKQSAVKCWTNGKFVILKFYNSTNQKGIRTLNKANHDIFCWP